jgi:glucosamine--fructose-6-phosphate aminotransferase (isomerizing)
MTVTDSEIASQPDVWARAAERTDELAAVLRAPGERILVVGCGTSAFMAASIAALRESAGLGETDWNYPGEVPAGRRYDRVVALTRSGTTTEVDRLLADAPAARRCVITAVPDSPIARHAGGPEDVVVLDVADEQSVVQTRFPTTVLRVAREAFGEDVTHLDAQCRAAIAGPLPVDVATIDHLVYLGSGWTLGLAHEAALKVREAAQAWSESYPALDYRHGPIAVAGARSLVWTFGEPPAGLVADVEATGATAVHDDLDPLVQLVLAQRVATALAAHRGLDPDEPRHLTRSVVLAPTNGAAR